MCEPLRSIERAEGVGRAACRNQGPRSRPRSLAGGRSLTAKVSCQCPRSCLSPFLLSLILREPGVERFLPDVILLSNPASPDLTRLDQPPQQTHRRAPGSDRPQIVHRFPYLEEPLHSSVSQALSSSRRRYAVAPSTTACSSCQSRSLIPHVRGPEFLELESIQAVPRTGRVLCP